MVKSAGHECIQPNGCQVEHLVGTYKELKEVSKNAFEEYIAEQDERLIPTLDANQEYITMLKSEKRFEILENICPHCPHRRYV